MSKVGNIVEPFTTIEKYGADSIRSIYLYVSNMDSIKFDEEV